MKVLSLTTATLTAGLMVGTAAQAAITGPYTADGDTLHLYHLDDAGPTVADSGPGNIGLSIQNGATLGNSGFTGFSTAGNTNAANNSIIRSSVNSPGPVTAPVGTGGAFTYEALVKISGTSGSQMIFSMDANANADRIFNFRIVNGSLQLQNLLVGDILSYSSTIPVAGDDAFVADEWFHAAVTYTGAEDTAGNLNFYWTRVDDARTEATLVGTHQMKNDLSTTGVAIYGVGNDFRTVGSGNQASLNGSIDEVRLSGVARSADEFIFAVPEPSSLALLGLGGLLIARRRRS